MYSKSTRRVSTIDAIQDHGFLTAQMLQRHEWQQTARETAGRDQEQKTGGDAQSFVAEKPPRNRLIARLGQTLVRLGIWLQGTDPVTEAPQILKIADSITTGTPTAT